jgi:predicted phosphodiesterase
LTRIGLISDTHNFLDENIFEYFKQCDEIWHAGDFGTIEIADKLITGVQTLKTAMNNDQPGDKIILRGVYGNIDGGDVRAAYTEKLHFNCEKVKVFMQHIGGYPNRYAPGVKKEIQDHGNPAYLSAGTATY